MGTAMYITLYVALYIVLYIALYIVLYIALHRNALFIPYFTAKYCFVSLFVIQGSKAYCCCEVGKWDAEYTMYIIQCSAVNHYTE